MSETESLLASVREILGGLKRTTEGAMLHGLIERGLRKFEATPMIPAFIAFAAKLLERYLTNPDSDPVTRIRVKVIQQRLKPYLDVGPQDEITAAPDTAAPVASPPAAVAPPPVAEPAPPPVVTAPAPQPESAHATTPDTALPDAVPAPGVTPPPEVIEPVAAAGTESLPEQLAREMTASLNDGDELDELLHKSLAAIGVDGASTDLTALKRDLVRGIEELLSEHRQLEQNLVSARSELQALDSDRRHLEHALTKAREQSLTDELTGLPNPRRSCAS